MEDNNEISYDDALVSLISMLDTPITKRKGSDMLNECVAIIKKELINQGKYPKDKRL